MSRWLVGQVKGKVWTLTVRHEVVGDVLVLSVSGRAGTGGSRQLADALFQAIGNGHRRVLCDIERLDYASSAGLLALNAAAERIRQEGGELLVCGMTDPVRIALDLSGIQSNFSVADSRAAALARFGTPDR
jgi:stage II sporulation protein AA (anti-sigma F factor antagonist)